jgi:hypothetical protein
MKRRGGHLNKEVEVRHARKHFKEEDRQKRDEVRIILRCSHCIAAKLVQFCLGLIPGDIASGRCLWIDWLVGFLQHTGVSRSCCPMLLGT